MSSPTWIDKRHPRREEFDVIPDVIGEPYNNCRGAPGDRG